MDLQPPSRRPALITPISRADLFEPGQLFQREELLRRVLSYFWRECCYVPWTSRAPAPVVEFSGDAGESVADRRRIRAWWLLSDGIIEEAEGPNSERVNLFFGAGAAERPLWPRYEFCVREWPFAVEMIFHFEPQSSHGCRVQLEPCPDGQVRVAGLEPFSTR
jgi:hypothetical protein